MLRLLITLRIFPGNVDALGQLPVEVPVAVVQCHALVLGKLGESFVASGFGYIVISAL